MYAYVQDDVDDGGDGCMHVYKMMMVMVVMGVCICTG